MRRLAWLGGLTIFMAIAPGTASSQGRPLHVTGVDGTCRGLVPCYPTIQAAVTAAQAGDRVVVPAGLHVEQVSVTGKNSGSGATESDRIVIEADPEAAAGSVVLRGAVTQCTGGFAVRFQQSRFVTLRGLTITGAGGPAVALLGGNNQNRAIHLERLRIVGNGSGSCDGGITVNRGNPGTVVANSVIHGNGRSGMSFLDADGGPHHLIGNTIHANGWNGVSIGRRHETWLVNNAITGNGTAPGTTGGRFGVSRESPPIREPAGVHLLSNLICGNRLGEIDGPALDATDAGNLTPTGTEGPGVAASAGCQSASAVYANPDADSGPVDDDFSPAAGSPLLDRGMDPRGLGLGLDAVIEADLGSAGARPRNATGAATARFDIGAIEARPANRPPVASAGPDRTVVERTSVTLDGTASADADGDPLTFAWSQTSGPTVILGGAGTATPTFLAPTVSIATPLAFELRVSDGRDSAIDGVTITALPANHAPSLDPIGDKTVAVGATLAFTVSGADPDGDLLTFAAAPLPVGGAFDPASRAFSFAPGADQVGTTLPVTFTASDGRGGTAAETVTITVTPGLAISITSPAPGDTLAEGSLVVRGIVVADGHQIGVSVNGFAAAVDGGRFAVSIPVTAAVTMLLATAAGTDGTSARHGIPVSVTPATTPPVTLSAIPASGVSPLTVGFAITGTTAVSIALDVDGDGVVDFTGSGLAGQRFTLGPGLYVPRAIVTDAARTVTVTTVVHVEAAADAEARFVAAWSSFVARLQAGDVPGALQHLSPKIRTDFEGMFLDFGADLPVIAGQLGAPALLEQVEDLAEAVIVGQRDGRPALYFIYFRRDETGRWVIEEM